MIKRLGYEPHPVADYVAFKTLYSDAAPAVILLSLELAGNENAEYCRYLVERQSRTAIILLSNMEEEETSGFMKLGQSAGLNMRGVLRKPVDVDALKDLLAVPPPDPLKKSHEFRLTRRADKAGSVLDPDQPRRRRVSVKCIPKFLISNRKFIFNSRLQGVTP
jgi:CheY-like chemotaxis protein